MVLADKIIIVPDRGHDTLDKVWGWSQFGSTVIAVIALGFAGASWIYARRAQRSADASASIAREELDLLKDQMSRTADIAVTPSLIDSAQPKSKILQAEFRNVGDVDAPGTVVNILAPDGSRMWGCANAKGDKEKAADLDDLREDEPGDGPWVRLSHQIDLPRQMPVVAYYRIEFPSIGSHTVRVRAGHSLAEPVLTDVVAELTS